MRSLALLAACSVPTSESIQALDMNSPWERHTISSAFNGADGVHLSPLGIATAWEESSTVTVYQLDGTLVMSYAHPAAEDAIVADVDADGSLDVISAGEDKRIRVRFGPGPVWPVIVIDAATNLQRWRTLAMFDGCIVAGGDRPSPPAAAIVRYCSPTPRIANSYTGTVLGPCGWTMSLVPLDVDRDGDTDLVVSDREGFHSGGYYDFTLVGSRYLAAPTWENHTIHWTHGSFGAPKMLHAAPGLVFDGSSGTGVNHSALRYSVDGRTWGSVEISQPADVGQYHDVEPGDIDGDGELDLAFSYSDATGTASGVVWLKGPSWERGEISGTDGDKFDNLLLLDLDGDTDLDVLTTSEQLGLVWYENGAAP
jgi:hypothetical protein